MTNSFLTQSGLLTTATNAAGASLASVVRNYEFGAAGNVVPFDRGIPFTSSTSSGGTAFASTTIRRFVRI